MPVPSSALTQNYQPQQPDVARLILDAAEPVWRKISSALQVKTRQQAVQIVQTDANAAAIVSQIIAGTGRRKSALTDQEALARSALTSLPAQEPLAERLYGGGGKARLRIG